MTGVALDPATLRALARELDRTADQCGGMNTDENEQYLSGYLSTLAATYRTRALRIEMATTTELPVIAIDSNGRNVHGTSWQAGQPDTPPRPGR